MQNLYQSALNGLKVLNVQTEIFKLSDRNTDTEYLHVFVPETLVGSVGHTHSVSISFTL